MNTGTLDNEFDRLLEKVEDFGYSKIDFLLAKLDQVRAEQQVERSCIVTINAEPEIVVSGTK